MPSADLHELDLRLQSIEQRTARLVAGRAHETELHELSHDVKRARIHLNAALAAERGRPGLPLAA
jgi:hypothetical protein